MGITQRIISDTGTIPSAYSGIDLGTIMLKYIDQAIGKQFFSAYSCLGCKMICETGSNQVDNGHEKLYTKSLNQFIIQRDQKICLAPFWL